MPIPSAISDLSTTPSLNSPAGSESPALVDDYLRTHAAFIKQVSDSNNTTNVKLTDNQTIAGTKTFSSAPVVPGLNGGQLAGMRNKIINGALKVDQRNAGASQTFTAGAALAYCADRWYGYCTGANVTGQRIALSDGQNRYRFTGAASNTGVGFGQRIEAVNSLDLAGLTATLSVKLSSSSLTSITWTAFRANTTDAFGTLASPTRTQIATGTFTINSTEATYSANISVPSAATTGIEIVFTGGALLGTQTLTIGDVQLEVGSVATPFEHRPYGAELALCQRYYCKSYEQSATPGASTAAGCVSIQRTSTASADYFSVRFPVNMRSAPTTITTYSTITGASGQIRNLSGASDVAANVINAGESGFSFTWTAVVAAPYQFQYTATSEL